MPTDYAANNVFTLTVSRGEAYMRHPNGLLFFQLIARRLLWTEQLSDLILSCWQLDQESASVN